MPSQPDIAVYSADHQLQLVVEIKNLPSSDPKWAAKLHRNLLAHQAVPTSPFFLLVLPDHLYLWSGKRPKTSGLPNYQASTATALRKYLSEDPARSHSINGLGLELAVRSWLRDLTSEDSTDEDQSSTEQWVKESGLFEAVKQGSVRVEALA
jgi:hypothetical protein